MSSAEILKCRSMRLGRDDSSSDELLRAHVEAAKGASAGPLHIHLRQEERFIVDTVPARDSGLAWASVRE